MPLDPPATLTVHVADEAEQPPAVGRRAINPPSVPEPVRAAYHRHLTALLKFPAEADHHGHPAPHVIELTPAAQDALVRFETELEDRLGEFGDLGPISDWAGKLVGAVVRVAGLLHMAEHADNTAPWCVPVSVETMEGSIEIGQYLTAHAQAAFNLMGADPIVEDARYILRWVASTSTMVFSKRELHQANRGRCPRPCPRRAHLPRLPDRASHRSHAPTRQDPKSGLRDEPAYSGSQSSECSEPDRRP